MIEHGKVRGGVPAGIGADAAAGGMLGLFIGIRVLARGQRQPEALRQMGAQAIRLMTL